MAHKSSVPKIYNRIIEDVASNVQTIFAEEGVPEDVLHQLVALWKSKLVASNAVDLSDYIPQPSESQPPQQQTSDQVQTVTIKEENEMVPLEVIVPTQTTQATPTRTLTIQVPASCLNEPLFDDLLSGPIITATVGLPDEIAADMLQQFINDALQNNQQQKVIKEQVVDIPQVDGSSDTEKKTVATQITIRGTDGASDDELEDDSQQKVIKEKVADTPKVDGSSDTKKKRKNSKARGTNGASDDKFEDDSQQKVIKEKVADIPQVDGSSDTEKKRKNSKTVSTQLTIRGTDGASDDELDEIEDDSSEDEVIEIDDNDQDLGENQAIGDDPLNSGDDISEAGSDLFEADNVIVCQFDKISHHKDKWKLSLKHGIMNLEGEDYVFSKATGNTFW